MLTDDYFRIERETSAIVDGILEKTLEGVEPTSAHLPRKRMGRPRLRDLSCRLGYALSGGEDWQRMAVPAAAYELENSSSYVINWIFDQKGGYKSRQEINDLIVAGMRLRELSQQLLASEGLEALIPTISDINNQGYIGQFMDINTLRFDRLGEYKTQETFMEAYEHRCVLLSGIFHGHCLSSGSVVLGKRDDTLYDIGSLFGSTLQSSNDLGDFAMPRQDVTTMEKPYNDQFSDLRQGKITMPVYLLLTKTNDADLKTIESQIGKKEMTLEDCEKTVDVLLRSGVFKECLVYLNKRQERAKKQLYTHIERTPVRDLAAQMLATSVANKFLYDLKQRAKNYSL